MNKTYRVTFRGRLLPGIQLEQAQQQFFTRFKVSPEKISHIFSGKKVNLRKRLSATRAQEFQQIFTSIGLQVKVVAEKTAIDQVSEEAVETHQTIYRVVFRGNLRVGISPEDARMTIASILKCPQENILDINPGRSIVLYKDRSQEQAEQHRIKYERAGLITSIEAEVVPIPAQVVLKTIRNEEEHYLYTDEKASLLEQLLIFLEDRLGHLSHLKPHFLGALLIVVLTGLIYIVTRFLS